ncbi:hypothetical protein BH11PLA2_BH11PLA2_52230 [soil metagenome]
MLEHHQKKGIQNQRVTLTLGSGDQVATVRRIFNDFVETGHNTEQSAASLNHDGSRSARGGLWNAEKVRAILTNVMYAGTLVYNKTTRKLKTRTRKNPVDQWIRTAGAFAGLVDPSVFERAQEIITQAAQRYSPAIMLGHLDRLYREHGFLRVSILTADRKAPSVSTYVARFASLDAAYQHLLRSTVHEVRNQIETRLRQEVGEIESYEDFLVINRKFTVLVQPSVPVFHGYSQYWYFRPDTRGTVDITLGVPVSGPDGPTILGYLALPRLLVDDQAIRLFGSQQARLDMFGYAGLEMILELARS